MRARCVDFLRERLREGDDGKTFLLGFDTTKVLFALAAGLKGEADHPAFLAFARYLVHRRFQCSSYALLLPAAIEDRPVYMLERHSDDLAEIGIIDAKGFSPKSGFESGLIGDLAQAGPALPGIKRRDFDRLYESLQVPLSE